MKRLPGVVTRLLFWLLPDAFAEDVIDDLDERYAAIREERGRAATTVWLLRELASTPFVRLHREARSLHASGVRARERPIRPRDRWEMARAVADVRIAARSLRRRPTFSLAAVATLAASIGAATLVFSVLEGVVLRPLPYPGGEHLHYVYGVNHAWSEAEDDLLRGASSEFTVSEAMVGAWADAVPGIEAIGGFHPYRTVWGDGLLPVVQESGAWVLPGFFEALAVAPLLGRYPSTTEVSDGSAVLVIGEALWRSRYGADPAALGRSVTIEDRVFEVVGVAPRTLALPDEGSRWWSPKGHDFADGSTDVAVFRAVARLAPDADPGTIGAAMSDIGRARGGPDAGAAGLGARLVPLREVVVDDVSEGITLLFLSVAAVVLIACVNLANLSVVRSAERRAELAMRTALGASRWNLVTTMLSESLVVCAAGGGLGVLLGIQALGPFLGLLRRADADFPRLENVSVNPTVLAFAVAVTGLTLVLSGLLPGLAASGRPPWDALREARRGGRGRATRRTQRTLLVVEAGLAVLLLTSAGLLTRSSAHVLGIEPGFDGDAVAFVSIRPARDRYPDTDAVDELVGRIDAALDDRPGIEAMAWAAALPGMGGSSLDLLRPDDSPPGTTVLLPVSTVSPGYFATLGIELVRGRAFTPEDAEGAEQVAVLSERMARRLFGESDPLGRTVHVGQGTRMEGGQVVSDSELPLTVVGIVGDVRQVALVMDPDPVLYRSTGQSGLRDRILAVRTTGSPDALLGTLRTVVETADPSLLIQEVGVLGPSVRGLLAPLYVRAALVVAIAALAGFLTVVGIYGVVAYVVSDQVREIGVRMVLGARSAGEQSRMVRDALRPVLVGSAIGLLGAWLARAALESMVIGVEPVDLPTYVGVVALLLGAAGLAAWIPARRASSVDPATVLNDPN